MSQKLKVTYMIREAFPPVLLLPWEFEGAFDGDQELTLRVSKI